MPAEIYEVEFADGTEKVLAMGGCEIVRKMAIGNDWNILVVAVLVNAPWSTAPAVTHPISDLGGLAIGITSSRTLGFRDYPAMHWWGWVGWRNYTPALSTGLVYGSADFYVAYKGRTKTELGSGVSFGIARQQRSALSMWFRRNGSSIEMLRVTKNSTDGGGWLTESQFWNGLEATAPSQLISRWGGATYYNNPSGWLTFGGNTNESEYGPLDAISVWWPLTTHRLQISAVGYVKLA